MCAHIFFKKCVCVCVLGLRKGGGGKGDGVKRDDFLHLYLNVLY